jgi:hypothetical protein
MAKVFDEKIKFFIVTTLVADTKQYKNKMIKFTCLFTLVLSASFLSCNKREKASNINYHRSIPYPESDLIEKFEFTSEPSRYPGSGSDMHWWTWGADDAVYIADDDGKNFGGPSNYAHLLKITGVPPKHKAETVQISWIFPSVK